MPKSVAASSVSQLLSKPNFTSRHVRDGRERMNGNGMLKSTSLHRRLLVRQPGDDPVLDKSLMHHLTGFVDDVLENTRLAPGPRVWVRGASRAAATRVGLKRQPQRGAVSATAAH
jgi:hypothetical protein